MRKNWKCIVSVLLTLCTIIALGTTAFAAEKPTAATGKAMVWADDVRVAAGEPAKMTFYPVYDTAKWSAMTAAALSFSYSPTLTGAAIFESTDGSILTSGNLVNVSAPRGFSSFTGTFSVDQTTDVMFEARTAGKNTRCSGIFTTTRNVASIASTDWENSSAKIIVQYPVNIMIDGTIPTGGAVTTKTTEYNDGRETYDANGTEYTIVSDDQLYVDTGSGQQSSPVLTVTAPDGYKAQYKVGNGIYQDVASSTVSLGIIAAEQDVSIKFVSTATIVSVTATPADCGDVVIGTESVVDTDVTFTASSLSKRFKITPITGYEIADVTYDGESVLSDVSSAGIYTLTMTAEDILNGANTTHVLAVTFAQQQIDVLAQVVGDTGGTIQYDGETVTGGAFSVTYTTSPVTVTFVPTDTSSKVDKVESTTNGGRTWNDATKTAAYDATDNTYTFENGITSTNQGVRVTYGPSINTIDPVTNPDPSLPDVIIDPDPYKDPDDDDDKNNKGMLVLCGAWANESEYQLKATVNGQEATDGEVIWSVVDGYYNGNTTTKGFGFVDSSLSDADIVSVDAQSGELSVKNSGIVRVQCTSTVDPEKNFYIVVVVPGDYDRDGYVTMTDSVLLSRVDIGEGGLDGRNYSKELADMDKDGYISLTDAVHASRIDIGDEVI